MRLKIPALAAEVPLSRFEPASRCGNHLEILWGSMIDGIPAALYVYQVSRTVGAAFEPLRLD
jgi:hypothetical protein